MAHAAAQPDDNDGGAFARRLGAGLGTPPQQGRQ